MKKVRKAVIPAAGLGTRVLPATKAMPKEMLPIVDKPAIQYIVEEAVQAGIEEILIITGRGKSIMEDHFDHAFELESALSGNAGRMFEHCKYGRYLLYSSKGNEGLGTRCFKSPRLYQGRTVCGHVRR